MPYHLDGIHFVEPSGAVFSGHLSSVKIEFPYIPSKPKYMQIPQALVDDARLLELYLLDQGEPLYYESNLDNYESDADSADLRVKRRLRHSQIWGTSNGSSSQPIEASEQLQTSNDSGTTTDSGSSTTSYSDSTSCGGGSHY